MTANPNTQTNHSFKSLEHPIKATALRYIREMILVERYEDLPEMLAIAREFGASEWEIRIALMRRVDPYGQDQLN